MVPAFDKISLWLKRIDYRTPAFVVDQRYPKCRKCGGALLPTSDEVPDDLLLAYARRYYQEHPSHRPRAPDHLIITKAQAYAPTRSLTVPLIQT
ncbi:MAG: hypothetical protein KDN22_19270 [Verrucomicrobiae bacterium]|nr:hypothetical protein [Verrucomicrobiae bacterium]